MNHGIYAYRKGCRCNVCVQANYTAQLRWRSKARTRATPRRVHGTINGYQIYGCRCKRCVAVNHAAKTKQRAAKKRLRTLVARGLPRDYEGQL